MSFLFKVGKTTMGVFYRVSRDGKMWTIKNPAQAGDGILLGKGW